MHKAKIKELSQVLYLYIYNYNKIYLINVPQDEVPSDSSLDCGRFFMFIPDHCIQSLQESNGFSAMQVAE